MNRIDIIQRVIELTQGDKDNGWIADKLREFIRANTEVSVGKLNLWDWTEKVPKNNKGMHTYYVLAYNDDKKEVVATNGALLIISKSAYTRLPGEHQYSGNNGKMHIVARDGSFVKLIYPDYERCYDLYRKNACPAKHLSREEVIEALADIKAARRTDKDHKYGIQFAEGLVISEECAKKIVCLPHFAFLIDAGKDCAVYDDRDIRALILGLDKQKLDKDAPKIAENLVRI